MEDGLLIFGVGDIVCCGKEGCILGGVGSREGEVVGINGLNRIVVDGGVRVAAGDIDTALGGIVFVVAGDEVIGLDIVLVVVLMGVVLCFAAFWFVG